MAPAKSVHWGVPWDVPDDSMLLVGIFEYGLGSWEAIKADQSLSLSSKVRSVMGQSIKNVVVCIAVVCFPSVRNEQKLREGEESGM